MSGTDGERRAAAGVSHGGVLHRRLLKLERVQQPSTEDKMETIHQAALAAMSSVDLRRLRDFKLLELAGREEQATEEQRLARNRFLAVYEDLLVAAGPYFTITEMDQILGAG